MGVGLTKFCNKVLNQPFYPYILYLCLFPCTLLLLYLLCSSWFWNIRKLKQTLPISFLIRFEIKVRFHFSHTRIKFILSEATLNYEKKGSSIQTFITLLQTNTESVLQNICLKMCLTFTSTDKITARKDYWTVFYYHELIT